MVLPIRSGLFSSLTPITEKPSSPRSSEGQRSIRFPVGTLRFNSSNRFSTTLMSLTPAECSASRQPNLLLERWIHVPVLEDLFQIRPYAQVRDVIGDVRKSMRHVLRDDDNVTRLYFTARVSHHCAAAGRTVQDCRHFAVWRRTPPVDDGAPCDQGRATRYDDVTLGRIIVEDAGGAFRVRTLLSACRRGVYRRGGIGATTASHRPAVNDGDTKLVLIHIDHPDRIIWNRALRIDRVLQHGLYVVVANVDAILWCLGQPDYRERRKDHSQSLQDLHPHDCLLKILS